MSIPVVQVDAFASHPFAGNPAAVCPLSAPLSAALMQQIAMENNLSETAFCVPRPDGDWDLRWFTPTTEVELCGHATLAAGHVLLGEASAIRFHTRSGPLTVTRRGTALAMDLPALPPRDPIDDPAVIEALGVPVLQLRQIREVHGARYLLAEVANAEIVRTMAVPDLGRTNVIVTAAADEADVDFVSRFFAPGSGVPEDPVTGSAHCTLTPFWADRLGRTTLVARQLSPRGGALTATLRGDRVELVGHAVTTAEGTLWTEVLDVSVAAVAAEIVRLHAAFVGWSTGAADVDLDREVGAALGPDFVLVDPEGRVTPRDPLLDRLRAGHGGNPEFRIEIDSVDIVARHGALVVVRYVEAQRGSHGTPSDRARHATATLERTTTGWRWMAVQETWRSDDL